MTALLISLLLKSGAIAGVALVLTFALGRRPAAERADLLRAAVLVLLVLPPAALFGPDLALSVLEPSAPVAVAAPEAIRTVLPLPQATVSAQIVPPPAWMWAVAAWCLGAALVLGRFALGLVTLARWSRNGRKVEQPDWMAALARLAPAPRPRLRVSPAVRAPLSWGLSPGRILIGPAQLARPDQAEAVLAHELAHIRRADWLFLALSRVAVALFWFNPLVWLVARELERLSEQAVDEAVVRQVDRELYARTLVGLAAEITAFAPAHGAAAAMTGPARTLAQRIKTVMTDRTPVPARPWLVAGAVAALAAVATPIAALELKPRPDGEALAPAQAGPPTPYVVMSDYGYVVEADGTRRRMTPEEHRQAIDAANRAREAARTARAAADEARTAALTAASSRAGAHAARLEAAQARIEAAEAVAEAASARAASHEARAAARDARRAQASALRAQREGRTHFGAHAGSGMDHAAIRAEVARATAEAREAVRHAARVSIDSEQIREEVRRELAAARIDMARGADDMERGARQMRQEAERLRDPAYRAAQVERQRREGHDVTDQDMLNAIPKMLSGADRMEQGAAQLRASAQAPV